MTRKIILSLLVIGAILVAVAGITFAIFSDNIASDDQSFTAGTVDIQVNGHEEFFETTLDMTNMEPGDCSEQVVTVNNTGTLPVNLWNWIYTWGDVFSCDPNPACNMSVIKTYISGNPDVEEDYIAVGGSETYNLEACLPLCAGNLCQGKTGTMRMFFHAVQESNLEGWDCVKLLYKEGPLWIPDPNIPAHGNKCYEASTDDGDVDFVVNGYDLTPDMPLQLMLNGPGGCSPADKIIAGDFDLDGTVDPGNWDPYYRGFWTGSAMSQNCDGTGEGVYAFAYGGSYGSNSDPAAKTDANGNFSGQWTAHLACPAGVSEIQAKFLVKQDASPWEEELDELDYQYILCP
jgi:predicted ribosomally synthesized peptide with SipW-like signal peptide